LKPDDVTDYESFLRFVDWLAADRADEVEKERVNPSSPWGQGHNGWENGTIEAYLDAAARGAQGHLAKTGSVPEATWREFARFLYLGKIYE